MSFCDRPKNCQKNVNSRTNVKTVLVAITVDLGHRRRTQEQDKVVRRSYTRVDEICDMFVGEKRKNSSLTPESLFTGLPHQREVQELHCHPAFKTSIVALRKPDTSHAALADLRDQPVNTEYLARQCRVGRRQFDDTVF